VEKLRSSREDLRNDRLQLNNAHRELRSDLAGR
jgi:hypothetical protein